MKLIDYFSGTPPPSRKAEEANENPASQSELPDLTWLMGEEIQSGMSIAVPANLIAEINKLEVAEI